MVRRRWTGDLVHRRSVSARARLARESRMAADRPGFRRIPMVRWYSPLQLANTGARVLISLILERWSDKREIQAALAIDPPHAPPNPNHLRLGFVADLRHRCRPTL